MCTIFRK